MTETTWPWGNFLTPTTMEEFRKKWEWMADHHPGVTAGTIKSMLTELNGVERRNGTQAR